MDEMAETVAEGEMPPAIYLIPHPQARLSAADTETLMAILRERGISWTAWVFDSEGPPVLLSSRSTMAASAPYGESVRAEMLATPALPAE